MTPERWQQIDQLYQAALDHDASRRTAFLNEVCAGDTELRHEVESLLASHERAGNFIVEPALKVAARVLARDQAASLVGLKLSHYRIESLLGVGGMGEVYLAEDTSLGRKVALKLLPPYFTNDAERLRRFEQEARAASALNHPNILTIYEIGQVDGHHYTATEFIEGQTLREQMGHGHLRFDESLDIAAQVASALAAAHEAGIVHRDIKPENIMVRRDAFVKVLDFGLAKLAETQADAEKRTAREELKIPGPASPHPFVSVSQRTDPGTVMGTVQYMSPEQARAQEVDARTDIWSLGVVLYEMVTGRPPFEGETPSHVVVSILEDQSPPLRHDSDVPKALEQIVSKALRKKKEERYQTAAELALELKSLRQELLVEERMKGTYPRDGKGETTRENAEQTPRKTTTRLATAAATSSAEYLVRQITRHKRVSAIAAAMILAFTTLVYSFYLKQGITPIATGGEAINSLAVLPFVNTSGDVNTEYVADGISDSIINSLSRLPQLRVISMNVVLPYKGKQTDPQKVGRDLNVRAVLLGRMTQRRDDLTITVELVDVRDNSRLWGEQYNRKGSDILSVQDEIAQKISEGLRLRLSGEEKKQLEKQYTQNTEAYRLYSLGRHEEFKNTKEGLEKSIEYYEQAIRIDSKYALAYVGLASACQHLELRGFAPPKETLRKAEWAAFKAVELDDTLSGAHGVLAAAKADHWDWAGAEKEHKRALELDPNSLAANWDYGSYLAITGRADEALAYAKRATDLDQTKVRPAYLGFIYFLSRQYDKAIDEYLKVIETRPNLAHPHFLLGEAYLAKGMYEEGVAELQKAVALENTPERWDRYPMLAYAYAVSGKRDEALKILAEQKRLAKKRYIATYNFVIIYNGLGDKDRAFEYLNKAADEGMPLLQVPSRPLFDGLRSDPRYPDLLRRMNLKP